MRSRLILAAAALAALAAPGRAADPAAITYQVRIVTLGGDLPPGYPRKDGEVAFLTDAQVAAAMAAAQGDSRVSVMMAPKLTADDGQEAVIRVGEQQFFGNRLDALQMKGQIIYVTRNAPVDVGTSITLTGRVSADRTAVATKLKFTSTEVIGDVPLVPVVTQIVPTLDNGKKGKPVPFTQLLQAPEIDTLTIEKALTIPTGRHAIIAGRPREQEERIVSRTPVLSDIPHVGRLFTNVGIGRRTIRTFVVVSPTLAPMPAVAPMPRPVSAEVAERQVVVKMMFVKVPAGFLRESGLEVGAADDCVLTAREMRMLTAAVRKSEKCEVLSAPRVQVMERQTGFVQVGPDGGLNVSARVIPTFEADGKAVRLRAEPQFTTRDPAGNQHVSTIETTARVPLGGTMAFRTPLPKTATGDAPEVLILMTVTTPEPGR